MLAIPTTSVGNVVLEGYIEVPAERIASIQDALEQHIALTRAEVGCLYFDVTADKAIEGRFNVFEIFTGRAAFDFHQKRAGASPWAEISAGIDRHYVVKDITN
ncbi:MAG: antibiotic biosynthesis monooxygenase [Pseudomonadota bacterium]